MTGEVVIDTVTFMGMHSTDDVIRGSCKTFFAQRLHGEIWMSLEHVGWCDDIVWQFPREVQDAYYPFMDTLHTDIAIRRVGYDKLDIDTALTSPALTELPMCERLLVGMVLHHDAVLYTVNPRLRQRRDLPVVAIPTAQEQQFPEYLEQLTGCRWPFGCPPLCCEVGEMYSGTIAPLITPLDDTGVVSERCVGRLIDSLRGHVTALMPALSSGEGWALTDQQWRQMVAATVAHSRGLPVLAGILLPGTSAVIWRAEQAMALGVDGVVVTAPFGGETTQEQIYQHYAAIRAAVEVALFVYNESVISGNHIELDTLVRICQLSGVVGIKESSGSPELTRRILDAVPQVPVFEGWEHLLLDAGDVAGFIGPLANLDPGLCNRMLAQPSGQLQGEINDACVRYGLHADDWYRSVKTELARRGILVTDRVVLTAVEPVPGGGKK